MGLAGAPPVQRSAEPSLQAMPRPPAWLAVSRGCRKRARLAQSAASATPGGSHPGGYRGAGELGGAGGGDWILQALRSARSLTDLRGSGASPPQSCWTGPPLHPRRPPAQGRPKGGTAGEGARGCRGHSLLCALLSPDFAFGLDEDLGERGRR